MPDLSDIITRHAQRVGIDPNWMKKIMRIESGGDPGNVTGSYKGLFQLSEREFKRHGGSGNIFDPDANTAAAANKLAQESLQFKEKYGRDPKLIDLYMIHQQGPGGYAAHTRNPDAPAWQNMYSTAEGKAKGEKWSKAAIWCNMSDADKAKYGSVEKVTSRDFVEGVWGGKIEGISASGTASTGKAKPADDPKLAFLEGKGKGTILGSAFSDDEFKQPQTPMPEIGDLVPRFSLGRMRVPT